MSTVANSSAQVLKLNSRREVAERTVAFEFTKPLGFEFKAGQFAEITWIDPEMLTRHLNGLPESSVAVPIYYVAGPPAMAKGLRAMLNDAGIDDDDIRTEEFGGY